jgi:hypothetical protein
MVLIRFKTLFFILVMAAGAVCGAPLRAGEGSSNNRICPMKCCKKAAKAKESNHSGKPFLCNLTMCSETVPSTPTASSTPQISGVFIPSELAGIFQTLQLTRPKEFTPVKLNPERILPGQPIYIAYNSLLV